MLVGYVSDERYVALCDVAFVFENKRDAVPARSLANGAVYADVESGPYLVTISKTGFGSKRVQIEAQPGKPRQFR